ncbi:hypothetical protein BCR44DRAFT_1393817 [Catenaria anguillulae PL171]|uniref:Nop domain-containing protein n=1 Tax=Catenaria anguillulae PL171 TaxID=765915 RepID=A0A1Y2H6T4_9FUNG|nr:hypothetical protein BCR44DRAFT_1393817 [Catenaria anguillulae PL171]
MDQDPKDGGADDGDDDDEDAADARAIAARESAISSLLSTSSRSDLRQIARVFYSQTFQSLLADVNHFRDRLANDPLPYAQWAQDDRDREYASMVAANQLLPDIDNDLAILHKYVIDEWGPRFPELASLVRAPLDYLRTVQALGPDLRLDQDRLRAVLPEAVVLSVTLALSTNDRSSSASSAAIDGGRASTAVRRGRSISPEAQARADEACSVATALDTARTTMLAYIESRMTMLSPNVSALVGTAVAARLIGIAGGLPALCRIPACNVMRWRGSNNGALGLSTISQGRHRGFIWDCEFVRLTPAEYRRKAARMISAKLTLCARMDMNRAQADGSYGRKLLADISKLLDKAMAPAPLSSTKSLPVPDEAPKKRRGGRRARKLKDQYATTDLAKAANRVQFNVAEEEVMRHDEFEGLGMLGSKSAGGVLGKVRAPTVDAKSKAKTSDKLSKNTLPGSSSSVAPGAASGTATSLAFTPVQGLEFADPLQMQQKVMAANERWFGMGFKKKHAGDGAETK